MAKASWYPDYLRTTSDRSFVLSHFLRDFVFQHRLRYMIYFRIAQNTKSRLLKLFFEFRLYRLGRRYGLEIKTDTRIGPGFCMTHAYNITISPNAVLGANVTMLKGSTVGMQNTGTKRGAPVIGNQVYIGLNATVIGNIRIGNDVLIAPNTLVLEDVPDHSVVKGNPCVIYHRDYATKGYI